MSRSESVHCPSCGTETNVEPGENTPCPECRTHVVTKILPVGHDNVLVVVSGSKEAMETVVDEREIRLAPASYSR